MGIIVKLKVNRSITAESWKRDSLGVEDEYGNPFRIIRLRWNNTPMHRMAEYVKMRGFEDAVIGKNPRTGDISITYRKNGSITWMRNNGIGSFFGEVAQTPKNMNMLASHYGDRLFTIVDADIEAIVKKMHEERRKSASKEVNDFNDKRARMLHTNSHEYDPNEKGAPELPLDVEKMSIAEQNRINAITKQELDQREAKLNKKEQAITEQSLSLIGEGVSPTAYSREYLEGLKFYEIRKLCKEVGTSWGAEDKKPELIEKILNKQSGKTSEEIPSQAGGLDS